MYTGLNKGGTSLVKLVEWLPGMRHAHARLCWLRQRGNPFVKAIIHTLPAHCHSAQCLPSQKCQKIHTMDFLTSLVLQGVTRVNGGGGGSSDLLPVATGTGYLQGAVQNCDRRSIPRACWPPPTVLLDRNCRLQPYSTWYPSLHDTRTDLVTRFSTQVRTFTLQVMWQLTYPPQQPHCPSSSLSGP